MKKNFILVFFMMLCSFAFSQNAGQTSYDWGEFDYHDYPASKQVYAVINMDGNEVTNQNFEIAPFCGDQLRGKAAKPIFYGDNYGYIYTFSVFGNLGDEITFKLYDYATGTLYDNVATENMVWNETPTGSIANPYTLHFASVAEVAGVKYGSLAKAVEKATTGATVNVINDVTLNNGIVISKDLTLDLKDNEITTNGDFYPVIRVQGGADVTVTGEGSIEHNDYVFVLGASDGSSAGNLTIESGSYVGMVTAVQVTNGELEIKGGDFSIVEQNNYEYAYLINCKDEYYGAGDATVSIKGGTFRKWNPEDNKAEGEHTNFCAEGYIAVYDAANETYTVQKGLIGKGTETEPFIIRNLRDLVFFRDHVNAGKTTYNAEGVHVALGANIDMASVDWSVNIGDDCEYTFDGIFDGKGFTLSNLNSEETAQKADGYICTGLFGAIAGNAVVKNLTIENVNIEATYTGNNAAAVVGFVYTGANKTAVIENVTVKGDVKINASGVYGVGAIVGYSLEKSGNVNIKNCVVDAKEGSKITAISGVGAIIGHAAGIVAIEGSSVNNIDITAKGLVGGVAGLVSSGKSVLSNNTVKNVALTATETNWVNSAAIAVGTMNKDGLTVANTTFENVNVSQMVGSVYANKPTSVVPAVEARIGNVYYTKFDNALEAAEEDDIITVLNQVVIKEDRAYDLDGFTVTGATAPNQMFRIQDGANVTVKNANITNNSHYVFVLGAKDKSTAGYLTIENGTYVGETTVAHVVKGLLTINGGEFKISDVDTYDYAYLINCDDANYKNRTANVEIKGGKFYSFNPENNAAEGAGTNFCAENYEAKNQGDDTYIVRRKPAGHVAYRADVTDKADREGIAVLLKEVYAFESLVVKVYNNETLMFTCTRRDVDDEGKVMFPVKGKDTTANIVLWGKVSGSWINKILVEPTELNVPNKIEVWSDGVLVDSYTHESGTVLGTNLEKYLALDCVKKAVAKIGETKYITLAKAIEAATAGQTITLIANVTEDVTIGKDLTIDGNEKNYTGNISVKGSTVDVLVKNVNFINGTNYAITTNTIKSITVENCTVKNYNFGFLYSNKSTTTIAVKDVTVDGCNYGMHWVYGKNATLENVTMTNVANGLYIQNYASKTITVKNSNISSIAIWERSGYSGVQTFKFEGDNTVQTLSASQYAKYVLPAIDATLEAPEGRVVTTIDRYVVVWNAGVYSVQEAVAKIENKYYATLAEAVEAATEGQTVTLLQNVELENTLTIAAGKVVTLDLNGKVVSGVSATAGTTAVITNKGNLTVMTSVEGGKITSQALTPDTNWGGEGEPSFPSYANNTVRNEGTFTLASGTIENTSAAGGATYAIDNYNGSTTNINGGLVYCENNIAIRLFCGDNIALNVNGGEVKGTRALWIQLAGNNASVAPNVDVNITNGTLTATGNGEYKLAIYSYSYGNDMDNVEINISGGTFNGDIALTGGSNKENVETLNITGGTFNGKDGDVYSYGDDAKAIEAITIEGGIFNSNYAEKYAEDNGYVFVANADGKYVATVGAYVAQIGETRYTSLAKAIVAATAGQTIEFIADITEDVTIAKNITIDGDGFDYTGTMTLNNINVTIQNVDFVKGQIYKNKKSGTTANVTVKGCTFDGQGLNAYAINVGGANNTIIENVTAKDYGYGLLQITGSGKSSTNIIAKDVTIDNVNYGFKIDYASSVSFDNVTMTNVAYYGIYDSNYGTKTYTVKNSTISSIQIWEREGKTGVATFDFVGANTVGTLSASPYAKYVLPAIDATLTAPEGHNVTTTVEGYVAVWNEGVYSVKEAVAQIGDNYYASIQEAIDAAESGDEIVLLVNINLDETALGLLDNQYSTYFKVEDKTVTIDLNGKTISGEFNSTPMLVGLFSTENNGHLTLVDNSEEGTALVDLKSGNDQVYALIVNYEPGCSITIDGGTYKLNKAKDAIVYTGASLNEGGVKIEDGIFELGNVGTGPSNGQPWIFNVKGQNNRGVQVNGGTFNADINHQYWANEVYVPETLALQNNGDGTWTVVNAVANGEEIATSTGAKPRNVGYASLADAVKFVKANGTVTVTAAHETTTTAVVEKGMTIDFAGYAITGDIYPVVRIQNNATVTVKNGNITNGDYIFTLGEGATESATSGNLIINGGKYHGETTVANVVKGLLTINGGEFSADPAPEEYGGDYRYLINCYDATYNNDLANVEIKGGTFHNWNPENNAAEGAGTNFCAAGYSAVETATGSNIWTVVPAQVQTLAQGWNWYSSYVEADNLLDQLKAGINDKGVMIKNHLGEFVQYESQSGWTGNLSSVSVTEMYMINNNDDVDVAVFGNIVDPSKEENAITIQSKWNWIGYPLTEEMSVSQALNDLAATDGDIIKAHDGSFSTYIEGYGWTSGLNKLEPRNGYMYYSYAEDGKEFNYSYPRSKEAVKANVTSSNNYWVSNVSSFATNMTMMAVLSVEGNEMKEGVEVAAFVNGEVRGSARPVYVDAIDRYVLFMSICGEDGEEVSFKYVDLYTEEEYAIDNKVVYSENAIIGTVRDLYELVCGTMGIGENAANTISIYPNPTTTNTAISFETVCDMVEVFNSLGAKVAEYSNVDRIDGVETAGVYVIRVTNGSTVQNCRLIVK